MPITQDRFMAVIDTADKLIAGYLSLRRIALPVLREAIVNANAVREHITDPHALKIINDLTAIATQYNNYFVEIDLIAPELIATIAVEKKHFQRVGKRNDRSAYYQAQARRRMGVPERTVAEREAQRNMSLKPSADVDEVEVADVDSPQYQQFLAEMAKPSSASNYEAEAAERRRLRALAKANGEDVI